MYQAIMHGREHTAHVQKQRKLRQQRAGVIERSAIPHNYTYPPTLPICSTNASRVLKIIPVYVLRGGAVREVREVREIRAGKEYRD